ncbi:hypothetical protein HRD49_35950 [Corallococcus exiguus]|uniref:hypothetical protein n=1 Tax=Corallococcus TaxID=83461 RepID=UPI0011C3DDDD|nr:MULTISPECIES: hypothetical protein [Corallococcus]NPC47557.1 hypothetical protein [Corallococcus exiguus]NRD67151.1 hypothetical protein [Corallococcus exiguus]
MSLAAKLGWSAGSMHKGGFDLQTSDVSNLAALLQALSNLGSFLGGVFSVAAFAVAVWGFKQAIPRELERIRHTKRAERRAEVAETVWSASFRLLLALRGMTDPSVVVSRDEANRAEREKMSKGDSYLAAKTSQRRIMYEAANALLDAWALADLHFEKSLIEPVERLWKVRADVIVDESMYVMELNHAGSVPDAWKRLFEDDVKKIDECEQELRRRLGPVALHDLERGAVPASHEAVPQRLAS